MLAWSNRVSVRLVVVIACWASVMGQVSSAYGEVTLETERLSQRLRQWFELRQQSEGARSSAQTEADTTVPELDAFGLLFLDQLSTLLKAAINPESSVKSRASLLNETETTYEVLFEHPDPKARDILHSSLNAFAKDLEYQLEILIDPQELALTAPSAEEALRMKSRNIDQLVALKSKLAFSKLINQMSAALAGVSSQVPLNTGACVSKAFGISQTSGR